MNSPVRLVRNFKKTNRLKKSKSSVKFEANFYKKFQDIFLMCWKFLIYDSPPPGHSKLSFFPTPVTKTPPPRCVTSFTNGPLAITTTL